MSYRSIRPPRPERIPPTDQGALAPQSDAAPRPVPPAGGTRGRIPNFEHDFRVDRIVTAEEVISCPQGRQTKRPPGILWDHLDEAKVAAVPVLRDLAGR